MSSALAIAKVTKSLAQVVQKAIDPTGGGVVIGRPVAPSGGDTAGKVHVYLYRVTPNAACANTELPTRRGDGSLAQRPQVALDLHYLLTFYGDATELQPESMLGAVMRDLHAHPLLKLADAVSPIRLTLVPLNLEELSKLWSVFFQTPYTLSVAYQASVVLIESEETPQPVPPVLQRGKDERGVDSLLGPFPSLERLHVGLPEDASLRPRPPPYPSAQPGLTLFLAGRNLGGDTVRLRFVHSRLVLSRELTVPVEQRTADELMVSLPEDAGTDWAAGIYTVIAVTQEGDRERTSNALPLALAPRILSIAPASPIVRQAGRITLTLHCQPQLRPGQKAVLLLAGHEIAVEPFTTVTGSLDFVVSEAPVGENLLVQLRVEGVDSMPFNRTGAPPRFVFDPGQKVTIQ
ncbi:MAG: DUF4255 domain-containing protein [Candidatus Competibacteraceae bacterium]